MIIFRGNIREAANRGKHGKDQLLRKKDAVYIKFLCAKSTTISTFTIYTSEILSKLRKLYVELRPREDDLHTKNSL